MTDEDKDIRWKQRFENYKKALGRLQQFIDKGELSEEGFETEIGEWPEY